ncbi:coiled-coil alpha-helical rod protein 1 isoform X2 [Hypomesus transpacificus]|uniref:coiled-coil alpha-helical rod protein 1 isoform X2 n=1 Tax=Hypomesus transpacificus TaxID=137520 RepID=UPI001F0713BE|nr:coiled-coil alpha-helical rod protein 1 isoform X2 [Hypomesus transpacificus]
MERPKADEKLNAPCDFVASTATRADHKDLMTPSHFTASFQSTSIAVPGATRAPGTTPLTWVTPAPTTQTMDPWLAINQAKQEILELRKENQRIMMLQGDESKRRHATGGCADSRTRSGERGDTSRWETEWRLDMERLRAESERLRGQVEALKEAAGRQREEMRDKESYLNRQSVEMEAAREELCKTKAELGIISVELNLKREEKDRVSAQLGRLERESGEEVERLNREVERSRLEAQRLTAEVEAAHLKAGAEASEHASKLRRQLEESQRRQETEARLCVLTQEVTQQKSSLLEVSAERDGLNEQLSQMGKDFETQSATLQSLRNYIGELSPEKGEKDQLTETIQRLQREKEALQVTTELLNVRLNSVNDILALQEDEMMEKAGSETLLKGSSKGGRVLRCWREKVFTLLVQLRAKDLETRGEREKLHLAMSSLERQVKEEKYQAGVFQHGLQDRAAELHLERAARQVVEQDLASTQKENAELKTCCQEAGAGLSTMTEAVQRCSQVFEAKIAELESAQSRLNSHSQRLTFAKRKVDTIQGLMMRKEALRRIQQQPPKPADVVPEGSRLGDLRAELALVCEERDELAQELKRTPDLVQNALADLRERLEAQVRQLSGAVEQGRLEAQEAAAGREEAERRLLEAHAQLEEGSLRLEQLSGQLLSQRHQRDRELSDAEERCARLQRETETQLNTARREHSKAVVALRQVERHAEREREQERGARRLQEEHSDREISELQKRLQDMDKDRNLLLATVRERGLLSEYKRARSRALRTSTVLGEPERLPGTIPPSSLGGKDKPPPKESLLTMLGDLQALSSSLAESSEDSAEEEGQGDGGKAVGDA